MATVSGVRSARLSFWAKMVIGISVFILFGFAQFGLRGMVDYRQAPAIMHVHGIAMVLWLGLMSTQALLVGRGGIALHRQLGWASAVMLPTIAVLASLTCITALRMGLFPPFFTGAYFLALVHVRTAIFVATVILAVAWRRHPDWHRRLMIGSAVLLMEPALGRTLPMPLIMPWGEWLSLAIELCVIALVVRHDRRKTGSTHPATMIAALAVVLAHVLTEMLAVAPGWIAFADRVAAG